MEISLLADTVTLPSIQALAYTNSSSLHICAAIGPPPVKSSLKTLPRRKRRTRRRSLTGGGSDDPEGGGEFYGYGGGGGDGSLGWGGGAGGGRWNFDGLGWSEDEESKDFTFDHAFYVVYKVLHQWIYGIPSVSLLWRNLLFVASFIYCFVLNFEMVPLADVNRTVKEIIGSPNSMADWIYPPGNLFCPFIGLKTQMKYHF
ncbi:hypothetical protein RHGRI_003224 [Rhododendron griersonianum]|uniref:Uncharacterized protein n=1 Tax=Rhododendron griersonianum TaxID=479676 RepID=A0AAV6L5Z0_9ERIC|nr:hypothetical protein RHGRI_003224 [Rhododendron griersonianum]